MLKRLTCFIFGHTPLGYVNLEQQMRPCARCAVVLYPLAWIQQVKRDHPRDHRGAPLFPW